MKLLYTGISVSVQTFRSVGAFKNAFDNVYGDHRIRAKCIKYLRINNAHNEPLYNPVTGLFKCVDVLNWWFVITVYSTNYVGTYL